jgi:transcriptional regulator with XRE-family HTH domain
MSESFFSKRLKQLRQEKNLTQDKLAKKIGVTGRHVGKYEAGMSFPSFEALKKLAEVLEVPLSYLLEENVGNLAAIPIRDKELLDAFIEVDRMSDEDRNLIKALINLAVTKNRMKVLLDGKK